MSSIARGRAFGKPPCIFSKKFLPEMIMFIKLVSFWSIVYTATGGADHAAEGVAA